jgi:hypothetical protein
MVVAIRTVPSAEQATALHEVLTALVWVQLAPESAETYIPAMLATATNLVPSEEEATPIHEFEGALVCSQPPPLSLDTHIPPPPTSEPLSTATSLLPSDEQATLDHKKAPPGAPEGNQS